MADVQAGSKRWQGDLRWAALALLTFVWLWWRVDPSRTYHGAGLTAMPAFSPDPMYLRSHLAVVGGPLRYLSAWLSQLFLWPAAGAALLTALAAAVAVAADRVTTALAGRRLPGYRYAPWVLFVLLDGHYLHVPEWQLGWVVALAVADCAVRWPDPRPALRLAVLLPVLALLYYLLGGPALVAMPLLALGEARRAETRVVAGGLVLWQALLPWLCIHCGFDQPLGEAYRALFAAVVANDQYGMVGPASAAMVAFSMLLGALASGAARPLPPEQAAAARRAPHAGLAWAGWGLVCALLLVTTHDRLEGLRLELSARAAHADWEGVLATADRMELRDITQFDGYAILLALAHTGQVGDKLFRYGLQSFSLLRPDDARLGGATQVFRMRSQSGPQLRNLELELGFVNEAEHQTHESLETQGAYPSLLVPMARIQVLNGRPEAARVFLRLAAAQPGDPAGARPLLRRLAGDPALAGDAVQASLAANRLQTDLYAVQSTTRLLEQAAREHPEHRLVQEYRLAWYLLTHQLERLAAAVPDLPRFGRQDLPRHYEEAVLCQEAIVGHALPLGRWQIRPATRQRFEQFLRALGCDSDEAAVVLRVPCQPTAAAERVWQGPWSDTCYYYRLFGTSGAVR